MKSNPMDRKKESSYPSSREEENIAYSSVSREKESSFNNEEGGYSASDYDDLLTRLESSYRDESGKIDFGIFDLGALPETMRDAVPVTNLSYLTKGALKDDLRWNHTHALNLSQSSDKEEAARGNYELAKWHGDSLAADRTICRAFHTQNLRELFTSKKLKGIVAPLIGQSVVFVPIVGREGNQNNELPIAFAQILATAAKGELYLDIVKKPTSANTGVSLKERAGNVAEF